MERTFGWLNLQRRLSKDYEALCETTETWIYIAMTGLTLRRLARLPPFLDTLLEDSKYLLGRNPRQQPLRQVPSGRFRPMQQLWDKKLSSGVQARNMVS